MDSGPFGDGSKPEAKQTVWIVLAHEQDVPAQWAAKGLMELGLEPLIWLEAEELAQADIWSHRLGRDDVSLTVRLRDGRTIESREIKGVLNRLLQVPAAHVRSIKPSDRLYVYQEMAAFYLSWLNGLSCPVLNPPQPNGMAGPMMQPSIWSQLATRAGLKTRPVRLNSSQPVTEIWGLENHASTAHHGNGQTQVFVVDDQVIQSRRASVGLPERFRRPCAKLACLAGARILGLRFVRDAQHEWAFAGADVLPDLREGGRLLLEALARSLRSRVAGPTAGSSGTPMTEVPDAAISKVTDRLVSEVGGALISDLSQALNTDLSQAPTNDLGETLSPKVGETRTPNPTDGEVLSSKDGEVLNPNVSETLNSGLDETLESELGEAFGGRQSL